MMNNTVYFNLKAFSVLKIFKFFILTFLVSIKRLDKKDKLNFKIYDVTVTHNCSKEVLYKKELQQSRFYRNKTHSNCSFASLR